MTVITCMLIMIACNKKALPTITERERDPLPPPKQVVNVTPDMEIGKRVFINRCGRCHDLPKPGEYTAGRWDGILSNMIPRARLDDEQGVHITAYLKANAAK